MRPLSLERQLPLLMSIVLIGIVAVLLALAYDTLISSAEAGALGRISRAAPIVASSVEQPTRMRGAMLAGFARDTTLRRVLARASGGASLMPEQDSAVRAALLAHVADVDTTLPLELWNARGERLAFVGQRAPVNSRDIPEIDSVVRGERPDSVVFSPLRVTDDRISFWGIAPISSGGRRVGFLVWQRQVSGPREAPRSLQSLIGEEVALYLRNADGSVWASAPGEPAEAPAREREVDGTTRVERPGQGMLLTAEAPVAGTPWVIELEVPHAAILSRARTSWIRLAGLSVALLAVGVAVSWLISRRITRPLASLTSAAEAIARGERRPMAVHRGSAEISRLAGSFERMATEVAESKAQLEQRVVEAQHAAAAVERVNAELQRAIGEADLAREEAERASRAKGDFLAVMSHELRTPLNAIAGYAQLLELGVHGPLSASQHDAVTRISRSQAHLLRLIDEVLSFARIDSGQIQYQMEAVSVHETLDALEPLVAPQMQAKRLRFSYVRCDPSLAVRADVDKLKQIVVNLLSNAIKFTPPDGHIVVRCDATPDTVRIRVSDTGVGIPEEQRETIFDPFVQGGRALNRPNEGVGLGLAISRDLARGMGGELTVESEAGRGSVFTLTLERAEVVTTLTIS